MEKQIKKEMEKEIERMFKNTPINDLKQSIKGNPTPINNLIKKYIQKREKE